MKAMSVGMIFAIIFAIFVMGLILVFGSSAITDLFCMGNDAQVQKSINDLQNLIDELYILPSGSGDFFTFNIPKYSKICLVNSSDPKPVAYPNQFKNWEPDPVYQKIIKEKGYNIWFHQCSGQFGGKIEHIFIPSDRNFCAIPGTEIYLQNAGRWVTIAED